MVTTIRYHDLIARLQQQLQVPNIDFQHVARPDAERLAEKPADLTILATGCSPFEPSTSHNLSGIVRARLPVPAFETLCEDGLRFAAVPLDHDHSLFFATLPLATHQHESLAGLRQRFQHSTDISVLLEQAKVQNIPLHCMPSCPLPAQHITSVADDATPSIAIGDLAHPLPHNLAQGAALAIEDAALLGALDLNATPSVLTQQIAAYQRHRTQRYTQCLRVTRFTDWLASSSRLAHVFRESMAFVPKPINGAVFQQVLDYSLAERHSNRADAWIDIQHKHVKQ
jgi:2-polyprenyl-6-methoxyphenol hydroxylase-like FAD-dependent oxidoreductase